MKIYTKTGDAGETGLFGGARVSKADLRVDAYGDVDEVNSLLGAARSCIVAGDLGNELSRIQGELFCVGAELASNPSKPLQKTLPIVGEAEVVMLETLIDRMEAQLPPLTTFILPGGSPSAAALHVARTACRRAERKVVALAAQAPVRSEVLRYVNRLSDALFVMARYENQACGVDDVPWSGRRS